MTHIPPPVLKPDVQDFLDACEQACEEHPRSEGFLRAVMQTVQQFNRVTPGQRDALQNIAGGEASLPTDRLRGSRRYEGFSRNDD